MRRNDNQVIGNVAFWGGLGVLTYLLLSKESRAQNSIEEELVDENLKYNPLLNSKESGGNPLATNIKGKGKFNYLGITQAKRMFGLECYSASVVNIFKSLGIIKPDMTRIEFELKYTNLHLENDAPINFKNSVVITKNEYRIPSYFNDNLRGKEKLGKGQRKITPQDFAEIASEIAKVSSYTFVTGMFLKTFKSVNIKPTEIKSYLNEGYVIRAYTISEDHYIVITDLKEVIKKGKSKIIIISDDTWFGRNTEYDINFILHPWIIKVA